MRDSKLKLKLALVSGGAGLAFAMAAMPVHAQTQSGAAAPAGEAQENEDERIIIVTGTNIRGVAPVGSSAAAITRKDIEQSGASQVSDLLRQLPQTQTTSNFNDVPLQDGPGGNQLTGGGSYFSNQTRGSSTDLRGLGPQATLVLIDGRRQLATGTTTSFVETNRLPLAAIERVEVVSDGASAVYGSDAVAGVINYITRKDYQGLEISPRYTTNKSYDQWGIAVTGGLKWNVGGRSGNVIISYDYDRRNRMTYGDNARTRADQTPFGGSNAINNINGTTPLPTGNGYYYFTSCPAGTLFNFGGICYGSNGSSFIPLGTPVQNFADIPAGTVGSPTTGTFAPVLPQNIRNLDGRDFLPKNERHSLNVYVNQELTDWLSVYYQFTGSERRTWNRNIGPVTATITRASPFFPTAPALLASTADSISVPIIGAGSQQIAKDKQYSNTVGAKLELPKNWQGEFYGAWAYADQNPGNGDPSVQFGNQAAIDRLVLRGDYNPFTGVPSAAIKSQITKAGKGFGDLGSSSSFDFVGKFNGPLFDMAGGTAKLAVGGEYSRFRNTYLQNNLNSVCPAFTAPVYTPATAPSPGLIGKVIPGSGTAAAPCTLVEEVSTTRSGTARRKVTAGFAELYLPLVGTENAMPMVQRLDLNLAGRWEHYSDFGNTFNPRVGLTWGMSDSLSLRASWGRAFRAPNLTELSASSLPIITPVPNQTGNPIYGPADGVVAIQVGGANPNLKAEKATNWSVGFDFNGHGAVEGLNLNVTYYNIHYTDKIVALPAQLFLTSAANAQLYARFLTPVASPNPVGCDPNNPATYPADVRAVMPTPPIFALPGTSACNAQLIVDARWQNAGAVFQDGIDVNLRYRWDWENLGTFNAGINLSKILHLHEELIKGLRTTPDPIDRVFNPLSFRARANVGWNKGRFGANLAVNYTPGYTNDVGFIKINPPPAVDSAAVGTTRIGAWTTADLNLSYSVPKDSDGALSGVRLGITISNLLDNGPPIALIGRTTVSYDSRVANPYGRQWNFQVTKAF